jgi:hypothetical protein
LLFDLLEILRVTDYEEHRLNHPVRVNIFTTSFRKICLAALTHPQRHIRNALPKQFWEAIYQAKTFGHCARKQLASSNLDTTIRGGDIVPANEFTKCYECYEVEHKALEAAGIMQAKRLAKLSCKYPNLK